MRKVLIATLSIVLLIAAFLPWGLVACGNTSVPPERLQQANEDYYDELEEQQTSIREAERQAPSTVKITVLETVVVTPTEESAVVIVATITPTVQAATTSIPITPTVAVVTLVVTSTASTTEPMPTATTPSNDSSIPLPSGLVDMEDTLTSADLTGEINLAPGAEIFTDLGTMFTEDGFRVVGSAEMVVGFKQDAEVIGQFDIVDYTLVSRITSVTVGGADVTSRYQNDLQQRMDTVLYQLLPQRFITSFVIDDADTMRVQSQARP